MAHTIKIDTSDWEDNLSVVVVVVDAIELWLRPLASSSRLGFRNGVGVAIPNVVAAVLLLVRFLP